MALHIKDPKTDRLARELAELTGESLTEAVTRALEDRLEAERKAGSVEIRRRRIEKILAELDALPVLDHRTVEEMLYDEFGLPK